jgi:hypothetical protein
MKGRWGKGCVFIFKKRLMKLKGTIQISIDLKTQSNYKMGKKMLPIPKKACLERAK